MILDELQLDIDISTCGRVYQRMKQYGTQSNCKRAGRPSFFDTKQQMQCLDNFVAAGGQIYALIVLFVPFNKMRKYLVPPDADPEKVRNATSVWT